MHVTKWECPEDCYEATLHYFDELGRELHPSQTLYVQPRHTYHFVHDHGLRVTSAISVAPLRAVMCRD